MLSLLAQQENGDNEVVTVSPSVPALEVSHVETLVDVDREDQIEREDDDQLLGEKKTSSSSNNDGNDENAGDCNICRAEEGYGNNDDNNEGDNDSGWRDLGDEYYGTDDDDDCLVF
jgi:hypothetical protein